jgi:hypothetical protein
MTDDDRLHIDIDLRRAGAVPQGTVSAGDASPAAFEGWLAFLTALERAMGVDVDAACGGEPPSGSAH